MVFPNAGGEPLPGGIFQYGGRYAAVRRAFVYRKRFSVRLALAEPYDERLPRAVYSFQCADGARPTARRVASVAAQRSRRGKGGNFWFGEAMKLMNEIQSEFDGTVTKILVKNGDSVEYDQPLMIIE